MRIYFRFEHAVLEIDQFDPKIEQDIEVLSCKSNDSGNTYYSVSVIELGNTILLIRYIFRFIQIEGFLV